MSSNIAIADLNLSNTPGTIQSLVSFKYVFPTGLYVTNSSLIDASLFVFNGIRYPFIIDATIPFVV